MLTGPARLARWLWLVPAACAVGSVGLLAHAWWAGVSIVSTSSALFTEYVVRPEFEAARFTLVLSTGFLLAALALRAGLPRSKAAVVAAAALAATNVLVAGGSTVRAQHVSEQRAHPDAQMLAALRAVPIGPDWVVQEAATVHRDADALEPVAYPEGRLVVGTGNTDREQVCSELVALLEAEGWQRNGRDGCLLSRSTPGLMLRITPTDPVAGAPVLVEVLAFPTWTRKV